MDVEDRLRDALLRDRDATPSPAAPTTEQLRALAADLRDDAHETAGRRGQWQRRLAIAAAVAAVVAAAGLHLTRDHGGGQDPRPGSAGSARQFLLVSARAVEARPFTPPRRDQVNYTRTVEANYVTVRAANGTMVDRRAANSTVETWRPQTPGRTGYILTDHRDGSPNYVLEDAYPNLLQNYAALSALPVGNSRRLLAAIAATIGTSHHPGDDTTVDAMKVIVNGEFFSQVLPPRLAAGVYRALADDPQVAEQSRTADVLGRPAVAIGVVDSRQGHWDVLFDPRTHAPTGFRYYTSADGPTLRASYPAGTHYYTSTAILQVATVDRNRELPGR